MRTPTGRVVRVWPGDCVIVRARLPHGHLARLFVFARERENAEFSPYVRTIEHIGAPQMQQPMSLRLTKSAPFKMLQFVCDIDGYVRIMQEVDTVKDAIAVVRLRRQSSSSSWRTRIYRRLIEVLTWPMSWRLSPW